MLLYLIIVCIWFFTLIYFKPLKRYVQGYPSLSYSTFTYHDSLYKEDLVNECLLSNYYSFFFFTVDY